MLGTHDWRNKLLGLLLSLAVGLSACSAPTPPTAAPPTAAPTTAAAPTSAPPTAAPATATPLPPTAAATALSTPASTATVVNPPMPATSAHLRHPGFLAFDAAGNLYISHCTPDLPQLFKVDPSGMLTVYAGIEGGGFFGDGGPALTAGLYCAMGLAFDRAGNLFVTDFVNNRIRRIDQNGIITTVVGTGGGDSGDGGPALSAQLQQPAGIVFDSAGNYYFADTGNNRIRKVDQQGIITTLAGDGTSGFSGDGGPATAAQFDLFTGDDPASTGLAFDAQGNLYVADLLNNRVRKINKAGIITTIAGADGSAVSGDGDPATAAVLSRPTGLAFDAEGNLYVSTSPSTALPDARVRKIDKKGIITTVAGTGAPGSSGDDGPATAATLTFPWGLAFDTAGNLYIADGGAGRVRRVDKKGVITTVVGGLP